MRTYAQLTTSFVVFCNRVGRRRVDHRSGAAPRSSPRPARPLFSAPLFDEGLFIVDVDLADLRRERIALPLLRDERPELQVRELTGSSPSGPAWRRLDGRRPRRGRARRRPGRPAEPIGFRPRPAGRDRRARPRPDAGAAAVRAAGRAGDRHRRRPPGHRRVHPRPAPPGGLRAGRPRAVGRDRLGARRVPRRPRRSAPSSCSAC